MPRVITELCTNAGACVSVCPVDCIVAGPSDSEWPWHFIDPDVCIDCGACQVECPQGAIFQEHKLPTEYIMQPGQIRVPFGKNGQIISKGGERVDLSPAAEINYRFFIEGPGYDTLDF